MLPLAETTPAQPAVVHLAVELQSEVTRWWGDNVDKSDPAAYPHPQMVRKVLLPAAPLPGSGAVPFVVFDASWGCERFSHDGNVVA